MSVGQPPTRPTSVRRLTTPESVVAPAESLGAMREAPVVGEEEGVGAVEVVALQPPVLSRRAKPLCTTFNIIFETSDVWYFC